MANAVGTKSRRLLKPVGFALGAAAAFTLAYFLSWSGFLMFGFLCGLVALARIGTERTAFYLGLTVGMIIYPVHLWCFYGIFKAAAILLWLILAFWLALFVLLAQYCFANFKPAAAAMLVPFLWTGLEYFRSELYYLRFSWLNIGYAFSDWRLLPSHVFGVYGEGFLLAAGAALLMTARRKVFAAAIVVLTLGILSRLPSAPADSNLPQTRVQVAGAQLEFPTENQVILVLNLLEKRFPEAELFVLSEYTFTAPLPARIPAWCREHHRYLIVGAEDPTPDGNFYDTAFVIDPAGQIIFQQGKCVPIQFFKDGLPAREQKLWASPWGKIGICVCYDLSYTRVTDELVRQGAQAIIVPTMDVTEWGRREHLLHARVAPVRAVEYGIPIFRVASSGISQLVDRNGHVQASAPFPGQIATLSGVLELGPTGSLPLDRILAPFSVLATGLVIGSLALVSLRRNISKPRQEAGDGSSQAVRIIKIIT
jgi:apolipoprotein N-acyltransferase